MFRVLSSRYFLFFVVLIVAIVMGREFISAVTTHTHYEVHTDADSSWHAPSLLLDNTTVGEQRELLIYGEELIRNTSRYFGPHGKIRAQSNGMNCQNCHIDAGTRPWGNNYAMVFSTYPKFRPRSGQVEDVYKRVSDCFERSLNGQAIDSNSREFITMRSYINWVGMNVSKTQKPASAGLEKLQFPDRAADVTKGKLV